MPKLNERRNFKNYRYKLTKNDTVCFCKSWKDVKEKCGIPRSALYQMLKGHPSPRHDWAIERTDLAA